VSDYIKLFKSLLARLPLKRSYRKAQKLLASAQGDPFDFTTYDYWWFSWYFRSPIFRGLPWDLRVLLLSILLGILLYLLGFLIAALAGFSDLYISFSDSWPILIGLFGISFFTFVVGVFIPRYAQELKRFGPIFFLSEEDYGKIIEGWANRLCDNRHNSIWAVASIIFFFGIGDILWLRPDLVQQYPLIFTAIRFMPSAAWYREPLLAKLLILNLIGLFVSSYIAVSLRTIIRTMGLMKSLGNLRLASAYSPQVAVMKFRDLANFHGLLAATYSIGVILGFIVAPVSVLTYGILSILTLASAGIILVPYYFLVRRVRAARQELEQHIIQIYLADELVGKGHLDLSGEGLEHLKRMHELTSLVKDIQTLPVWLYEIRLGVGNVLFTYAVAAVIAYLKLVPNP
jgi:hypothetical protein